MAALAIIAGAAGAVCGQHALDRNLQQGSGGLNPQRPDMAAEMRFRNAIVTGNAPGGLSFRGDVGYVAPGEFFGRVGGDDTFSFRRDTVYSGMGGVGIRGTESLQYQFALTSGRRPPPGLTTAPVMVPRSGTGATAGILQSDPMDLRGEGVLPTVPPRWSPGDDASDTRGLTLSALRAPSVFATTRTFQPTVLGMTTDAEGIPMGVTASVLRGVAYGPVLSGREIERTDAGATPAQVGGARPTGAEDPLERRMDMGVGTPRTPYEELLERIRRPAAERIDPQALEDPHVLRPGDPEMRGGTQEPGVGNRLSDLRLQLQEPTRLPESRIGRAIDGRLERLSPVEGEQERAEQRRDFSPETIDMLRRAGQVDVLSAPGFDVYGAHMEAGQRHLAAGRYFDAEERFTAALSARPGDPMASVGRIHAALGAGMFLSAAINLRDVLTTNPELVGVRYSADLLPAQERLTDVKERLVELIRTRPLQARESGMLLAYVGFQSGDKEAMDRGLAAMEAPAPEGEPLVAADEQMVRLAALLREVWREADQPGNEGR